MRNKWDFIWRGKGKMARRDKALKTELACHRWKEGHPSLRTARDLLCFAATAAGLRELQVQGP